MHRYLFVLGLILGSPNAHSETVLRLPPELEGIELGLGLENLAVRRPRAATVNFGQNLDSESPRKADLSQPTQMLLETLPGNPRFDSAAFYVFNRRLTEMTLTGRFPSKEANQKRKEYARLAIGLWGESFVRKVYKSKSGDRILALQWGGGDSLRKIAFGLQEMDDGTATVVLSVKSESLEDEKARALGSAATRFKTPEEKLGNRALERLFRDAGLDKKEMRIQRKP